MMVGSGRLPGQLLLNNDGPVNFREIDVLIVWG
jgi:hypothetical protein